MVAFYPVQSAGTAGRERLLKWMSPPCDSNNQTPKRRDISERLKQIRRLRSDANPY